MRVARANVIGLATFTAAYPKYSTTRALDDRRARDYPLLDSLGHVYLDYTAGNLVPLSLVDRHMALLRDHLLGNPHSTNPASALATTFVEQARLSVLDFFNADPDEYVVVFTANATQALKLVGEAYPFDAGGEYLLTFDNHNSVNGIREFARAKGCPTTYVPIVLPDMRVDEAELAAHLERGKRGGDRLFAYPAQSNFSGVQHPLDWIPLAQERGWDVLLDAAAFTPTNRLDLGRWRPDFVSQSFYKMFGYPTGVGCLIARKAALAKLRRPWFAGGTITVASVQGDRFYLAEGASAFEDGTPNYLALPAVEFGLEYLSQIGIDTIHTRVRCLTGWLIERLTGCATRMANRWRASTGRDRTFDAAAPSRSTSTTPPVARSITATSKSARTPPASHFERVASAIQAEVRLRLASRAPNCRRASISPSTKPI